MSLSCLFMLKQEKNLMYWKGSYRERQEGFHLLVHTPVAAITVAGSMQRQDPGTLSMSLTQVAGTQALGPSFVALPNT